MVKKLTKPDSPKALVRREDKAQALQVVTSQVNEALATLVNLLSEATPEIAVGVHAQLKAWEDVMKDVKDITRGFLLNKLTSDGKKTTEKGSLELRVGSYLLEARPHRTGLDAKKVESLLRAKGLDVESYMDMDIKYVLNELRIKAAVSDDVITQDELDSCQFELSYALQAPKKVSK